MGGLVKGIVGGVTDIFSGRESQEMGEDILNATIRGREQFGSAGQTLMDFYEPYAAQAEPTFNRFMSLITGEDYSGFTESPGYQFAQDEMAKAVERSAAASGGLVSGKTLKALQDRSSNIANQNFQTYLSNLSNALGVTMGAGEASAGVPFRVAAEQVPLDIYGQQAMGEGNIARVAGLGSGIGQIGGSIANAFAGGGGGGYIAPDLTHLTQSGMQAPWNPNITLA